MNRVASAVVLLSGGLDSATAALLATERADEVHALTFDYQQRHDIEISCAKRIATALGLTSHRITSIDSQFFQGSALTDDVEVPLATETSDTSIPSTYVPARNTIFLAYAIALAEITASEEIYIGVTSVDYSGYPDCRPEYIAAFNTVASLATKAAVEDDHPVTIQAPLVHLSKASIIQLGIDRGFDYSLTNSCYTPNNQGHACGTCEACHHRQIGFRDAHLPDPTHYASPA